MYKIALLVALMAVIAASAGLMATSTQSASAADGSAPISPTDVHEKTNMKDVPVQAIEGLF